MQFHNKTRRPGSMRCASSPASRLGPCIKNEEPAIVFQKF